MNDKPNELYASFQIFLGYFARILCVSTLPIPPVGDIPAEKLDHVAQNKTNIDRDQSNVNARSDTRKDVAHINTVKQWKSLGFILDRCFFIFFILMNVIAIFVLFPRKH